MLEQQSIGAAYRGSDVESSPSQAPLIRSLGTAMFLHHCDRPCTGCLENPATWGKTTVSGQQVLEQQSIGTVYYGSGDESQVPPSHNLGTTKFLRPSDRPCSGCLAKPAALEEKAVSGQQVLEQTDIGVTFYGSDIESSAPQAPLCHVLGAMTLLRPCYRPCGRRLAKPVAWEEHLESSYPVQKLTCSESGSDDVRLLRWLVPTMWTGPPPEGGH